MANQRKTVGIRSVEDAEKIIQSYAYGKDLDQAILYLKKHEPENAVLATIKDFENDRPMLKVLNALYRADEARKNNDTAELQKIAEFLNSYKAYKNRSDMAEILKEFPEMSAEEVAAVEEIAAETEKTNRIHEKQEIVREKTPSMSDDEIVANSEQIQAMLKKWSDAITEKDNVTVVDSNGEALDAEKAKEIRGLHRQWVELDIISKHSDNAAFVAMSDQDKEETLKRDIYDRFWSDVEAMAATTADLNGADGAEIEKVRAKAQRHEPVVIRADVYDANREELKEDIANKVNEFGKQKKEKSKNWLASKFEKLNNLSRKITGYTPVEFGKMVFSVFSKRRFAANVAASMGALGLSGFGATSAAATIAGGAGVMAAVPAIAVAATGIAVYGLYSAYSQQRWSIWEKKHANWKAAKAKGDTKEMAKWSGMAGWNNALKAIKANPEENKVYEQIKKNNKRYGLLSGLLMGAGTALVPGSAVVGRALGAGARATGANVNATFMYNLAKQKYAENQTEQNEINMKRARTGLILGIAGTALMEAAVAYSASHPIGVEHNPENVVSNGAEHSHTAEAATQNENAAEATPGVAAEAAVAKVDVPNHYSSDLGGTEKQWTIIHKYGDDIYEDHYLNTHNAQQAHPDAFVNSDGSHMTTMEAQYKSQVILEGLAKEGKDHHFRLFDENHQEVFAQYKFLDAKGTEIDVSKLSPTGVTMNGQEVYYAYEDYEEAVNLAKEYGSDSGVVQKFAREHGFIKTLDHYEYKNGTMVTSNDIAPECWGNEERVETFRAIYKAVNCGDKVDNLDAAQINAMYKDVLSGRGNAYAVTNECGDIKWYHTLARRVAHKAPAPVIEQTTINEVPPADADIQNDVQIVEKPVEDAKVDGNVEIVEKPAQDHQVDDGAVVGTKSQLGKGTTFKTRLADGHHVDGGTRMVPGSMVNVGREVDVTKIKLGVNIR